MSMSFWQRLNGTPVWVDGGKSMPIGSLVMANQKIQPEIASIFGKDGILVLNGGEYRWQQEALANRVLLALRHRRHLLGQAGTGTGKSRAALAPAIQYAMETKTTVLIATASKNLQRQLMRVEIPTLRKVMGPDLVRSFGQNFQAAALAGRDNYQCKDPKCFVECSHGVTSCYGRARYLADTSHLLIVNQAMLAIDVARPGFLPSYGAVIIDEAHQWPKWMRQGQAHRVNAETIGKWLGQCDNWIVGNEWMRGLMAKKDFCFALHAAIEQQLKGGRIWPSQWDERLLQTLEALMRIVSNWLPRLPEWLHESTDQLLTALSSVASEDPNLVFLPTQDQGEWGLEIMPVDLASVSNQAMTGKPWVFLSATLTTSNDDKAFAYFRQSAGIEKSAEEIDVGSPFDYRSSQLYYVTDTQIAKRRVFNRKAMADDAASSLSWEYAKLIEASGGNCLCLFTSYEALNSMASALQGLPYPMRRQKADGEDQELIDWFKSTPGAVLFSASLWEGIDVPGPGLSMVIIDRLPLTPPDDPLLLARTLVHCEGSKSRALRELSLPAGILQLKQGVGRLKRCVSDRGVVAIMDSRLRTEPLFRDVLSQLPGSPTVARCLTRAHLPTIAAFLNWQPNQGVA